jgi:hypothetical protein
MTDFFDDNDPTLLSWSDLPLKKTAHPIHSLMNLTIQIPNLRYLADDFLNRPKTQSNVDLVLDLVRRCQSLDADLSLWPGTTPDSWTCQLIGSPPIFRKEAKKEVCDVCPGVVDIHCYQDIWIASLWNIYRTSRIFVEAITLRCSAWLSDSSVLSLSQQDADSGSLLGLEYSRARTVVLDMLDGICASVPFHLGALPDDLSLNLQRPWTQDCPAPSASRNRLPLRGYFLVLPLFVARSVIIAPEIQRGWVEGRMKLISNRFGIKLAGILASWDERPGWPVFDSKRVYHLSGLRSVNRDLGGKEPS